MVAICSLAIVAAPARAVEDPSAPPSSKTVPIYATADDSALAIGTLDATENPTPIAESQGGETKWYLVKSRSGVIGWIKQSDAKQAKNVEKFFKSLPSEPPALAITIPGVSSSEAPPGAIVVPVLAFGSASIVSATLNQSITANLLLDTGATRSVISRRMAKTLALVSIGNATIHTVGGPITAAVARLGSLKVGEAELKDIPVIVHDFSPDHRFEGLLGMDFLSRYKFGLDAKRRLLVLSPR